MSSVLAPQDLPSRTERSLHDLSGLRALIDARLQELLPAPTHADDRLAQAMRYGVLGTGKRIRPLLTLLAARGRAVPASVVLDAACAVELVHAASLYLDDMPCMDNAALRRGKPTVHAAFGEDVAVLAAVAQLSLAWRIVATAEPLTHPVRNELTAALSDAVGVHGLVRGQYRDLREGASLRLADEIALANEGKTGALFALALDVAALAAGANDPVRTALRSAATELGHAYQLRDDLLDASGPALTGKDSAQDAGKSTLVSLLGHKPVTVRLKAHVARAQAHLRHASLADEAMSDFVGASFGMDELPA